MPQLPSSAISDEAECHMRNAWATMERVKERLKSKGVIIPETPPTFPIPEVTTTLVDTNNQEYLKTNARYLAWLNFLLPHLALAKGIILEVQNERSNIETLYRQAARDTDTPGAKRPKASKEETSDATCLDPRWVELTQIEQEMTQEKYLLEAKIEELERTLRVISRHVEMKKLDVEANKTSAGLPQRYPYANGRERF